LSMAWRRKESKSLMVEEWKCKCIWIWPLCYQLTILKIHVLRLKLKIINSVQQQYFYKHNVFSTKSKHLVTNNWNSLYVQYQTRLSGSPTM
jgi:hypothetical protein